MTIISLIAAIGENRELGNQGKIPWHIKQDLLHFKNTTNGHVVIMGRKAFDSLLAYYKKSPNPIPKRIHIVVTRNKDYKVNVQSVYVVHSIKEALQLAKEKEKEEIFIAGGGQLYKQTIKMADKLYLTIVKDNFKADTFFPDYSEFKKVVSQQNIQGKKYNYSFLELEREK